VDPNPNEEEIHIVLKSQEGIHESHVGIYPTKYGKLDMYMHQLEGDMSIRDIAPLYLHVPLLIARQNWVVNSSGVNGKGLFLSMGGHDGKCQFEK
jgi:hypothetical protein